MADYLVFGRTSPRERGEVNSIARVVGTAFDLAEEVYALEPNIDRTPILTEDGRWLLSVGFMHVPLHTDPQRATELLSWIANGALDEKLIGVKSRVLTGLEKKRLGLG